MRARSVALIVVILEVNSLQAQQPSQTPLSATAQKMKARLNQIGIGNKLTVWKINGRDYHGRLQSIEPQTFSMQEVDLKTTETIPYVEVKNVSKNYGGKTISGHHMSYRKQWLGIAIGTAGIFGIIILAAIELGKA